MPAPHEIPAGLEVVVADHPLANSRLSAMRDVPTDNATSRAALRELPLMLVYEASRNLATERVRIDTPMASTVAVRLSSTVPSLFASAGVLRRHVPKGCHQLRALGPRRNRSRRTSRPNGN
jgi:uracil phosphoribosyltransferase